jgi:hypothetical protein
MAIRRTAPWLLLALLISLAVAAADSPWGAAVRRSPTMTSWSSLARGGRHGPRDLLRQ